MILESTAFTHGGPIPTRHTCDGADVSPPLSWRGVPAGTVGFALVMDDPDAPAGTWVHWVLFDLPESVMELREGVSSRTLPAGATEGTNSWGRSGYGGPCPPTGTHRYFFKLYALDAPIRLEARATAADVAAETRGHVLAESVLMGRYARRQHSSRSD
jgi:Raf kinase inhibitor-like YbhB/YbcL family protein